MSRLLSWVVLSAGVGYTLALQAGIKPGVFFSGDGGLKALMVRQFASGLLRFDLVLPANGWIRELWDAGLHPFQPPFAYTIAGYTYTTHPFPFLLASAPFYALFGQRGLYVLPLLATWALWLIFRQTCLVLEVGPLATCAALATLIFASPLTFYSATYWEHTLAVFLAFLGVSRLLRYEPGSRASMFFGGAALGLSTWFREEMLCLCGGLLLILALSAAMRRRGLLGAPNISYFFGGMLALVAGFFFLNAIIYGHPLGVHSLQILHDSFSLAGRIVNARTLFVKLSFYLLDTFPMAYWLVFSVALLLAPDRFRGRTHELFLLLTAVLFAASVPFVLPDIKLGGDGGKQWGPRFWLLLMPLISLTVAMASKRLWTLRQFGVCYVLALSFAVLFGIGAYKNTYKGTKHLIDDYATRVLPALEMLQRHPDPNIVVHYQHMAQELYGGLPQKNFFLVQDEKAFERLAGGLLAQKMNHFLYVRYYYEEAPEPVSFAIGGKEHSVKFTKIEKYGIYTVDDASIE